MSKRAMVTKLTLLFILLLTPLSEAGNTKVYITNPTPEEQVLESGRDFYILGVIDRKGKKASEFPIDIKVEVVSTGEMRDGIKKPLRTVQSRVDKKTGITSPKDIFLNYQGKAEHLLLSDEELLSSPPPDLVYHHEDPKSFYDPSIKAIVMENSFAVLIQGGCTKSFDTDYEKIYSEDLEWGLYRVLLTVMLGDTALEQHDVSLNSHSFDVMFGSVQEKILARFSPKEHLTNIEAFAKEQGLRIYKEPFPGYWNIGLPATYEIPLRWRTNNSLEYISGRIHAIIYNISQENCATQSVEIGRIAFEGFLDSEEICYYHYDIGEPKIKIRGQFGDETIIGKIIPFRQDKKLCFTRAEFNSKEYYSATDAIDDVDTNVYNAVAVDRGKTLTLCGVVTPIQPHFSDVVSNNDGSYTVNNRIAYLHYDFVNMIEGSLHSEKKSVELERIFEDKETLRREKSIYEFRHTFNLPKNMDGKIVTVTTKGYDIRGDIVDGTEEKFYLWIR